MAFPLFLGKYSVFPNTKLDMNNRPNISRVRYYSLNSPKSIFVLGLLSEHKFITRECTVSE